MEDSDGSMEKLKVYLKNKNFAMRIINEKSLKFLFKQEQQG